MSMLTNNLTILRLLFVTRLIFGFYYQVRLRKRYLIKMYCITISTIVCSLFFYQRFSFGLPLSFNKPIFHSFLEYMMTVVTCLICDGGSYVKYFRAFRTGDKIMGFKPVSFVPIYMYYMIVGVVLYRIVVSIISLFFLNSNMTIYFLVCFMIAGMDWHYLLIAMIFSFLHNRMRMLRKCLQDNSVNIRNIRKILFFYEYLLNNVQTVDEHLQYMLTGCLLANIPKQTIFVSVLVRKYLSNDLYSTIPWIMEIIPVVYSLFFPAVMAELLAKEVDEIKIFLATQLSQSSDETLRCELMAALEYVSLRPFRYVLARVVPFDIKLVFTVSSLAITYCIVLFQFMSYSQS